MERQDPTQEAYHTSAVILSSCQRIETSLQDCLAKTDQRPDINYDLLRILLCADDLLQMVEPAKEPEEFHGVPEAALDSSRKRTLRFRHRDRPPEWDFAAWFGEKASNVKQGAKDLVRYWLMDLKDVRLSEWAPMSSREWLRDMIVCAFHAVQGNARTIFDEIHKDGLVVEDMP